MPGPGPCVAHGTQPTVRVTGPSTAEKPVTQSRVTGSELRK